MPRVFVRLTLMLRPLLAVTVLVFSLAACGLDAVGLASETSALDAGTDATNEASVSNAAVVDGDVVDADVADAADAIAVDATDAQPPPPCDGGPVYTHGAGADDPTGGSITWTDCVPLATFNETEATKACNAWCTKYACVGACSTTSSYCGRTMAVAVTPDSANGGPAGWEWIAPHVGSVTYVNALSGPCAFGGGWN